MKNFLLLLLLITYSICDTKKIKSKINQSIISQVRTKLFDCISKSEGISENLKKNIDLISKSKRTNPINFNRIKQNENDMEIIRSCKREVFKSVKSVDKNK